MTNILPKDLTASNLEYVLDGLDEGDALVFKRSGGVVTVTVSSSGLGTARLNHRIDHVLQPIPVTQSWFPMALEDDGTGRATRSKEKLAKDTEKRKANDERKKLLLMAFEISLAFKDIEDATLQQNDLTLYYEWDLNIRGTRYLVYTKLDKRPVMFRQNGGDLEYLS